MHGRDSGFLFRISKFREMKVVEVRFQGGVLGLGFRAEGSQEDVRLSRIKCLESRSDQLSRELGA